MNTKIEEMTIVIPKSDLWISRVKENAGKNIRHYESCSQSILAAFMAELGIENRMVIRSAGAMAGGLFSSLTCGIHLGGLMTLGLIIGREDLTQGVDGLFPIIAPAQELVQRLNKRLGSHSCLELTGVDFTDMEKAALFYASSEREKCIRRVEDGAEEIALFLKEMDEKGALFRLA